MRRQMVTTMQNNTSNIVGIVCNCLRLQESSCNAVSDILK